MRTPPARTWALVVTLAGLFAINQWTQGQASPASGDDPSLRTLANEVLLQQQQALENQAQLESRVESLTETIRQARIFAARGGGRGGAR